MVNSVNGVFQYLEGYDNPPLPQLPSDTDGDFQLTTLSATLNEYLSKKPSEILDIGCGNGILVKLLVELKAFENNDHLKYIGFDFENKLLNTYKTILDNHIKWKRFELISDPNERKNYIESSSIVVIRNVFHELSISEASKLIYEICSFLNQNSVLLLQDMTILPKAEKMKAGWLGEHIENILKFGGIDALLTPATTRNGIEVFHIRGLRKNPCNYQEKDFLNCLISAREKQLKILQDKYNNEEKDKDNQLQLARLHNDMSAITLALRDYKEDILFNLDNFDHKLSKLELTIREIVDHHNRKDPLSMKYIFEKLKSHRILEKYSDDKIQKIVQRLQERGYLQGIIIIGDYIFIDEERLQWKIKFHTEEKKKIAQKAIEYIKSGFIIVLDAGSTTLELSRQISEKLKNTDNLKDLTIITNSIPAANELLNTAKHLGLDDNSKLLKVYMVSGRIRPNTEALVTDETFNIRTNFESIFSDMKRADIAFVGTNGIFENVGFTTHHDTEKKTKSEMLKFSRDKFILTDPSKFGIKEEKIFAEFDEEIKIITLKSEDDLNIKNKVEYYENYLTNHTKTRIIYA